MNGMTVAFLSLALTPMQEKPSEYVTRITKWRQQVEADLRKDGGWLTVVGLAWLKEGSITRFGVDTSGSVTIPWTNPTGDAGAFMRTSGTVKLTAVPGSGVLLNGEKVDSAELKPDADKITLGTTTMSILKRGDRVGVRVYDTNSKARKEFTGRRWYPVNTDYVVKAKFVPYPNARTMPITNVLGDVTPVPNPGYVEFTMAGKKCRLEAQDSGEGYFFNFQDATSGKTTYPAGRFLDSEKVKDGFVVLDFNLATNPPCAFTSFATCPLPPAGNKLTVAIKAGELSHHP